MFHHVDGERVMIESGERGTNRDPYTKQAAEESSQPARPEMCGDVGERDSVYGRGEASFAPSATEREASRAGASAAGCNVFRNETNAVVSGGLRFFP